MKITYPGHANLLVEGNGINFMCDPWLESGYVNNASVWLYPPVRIATKDLPKLDFIYISHEHDDHCNIETQRSLPDDLPIYILNFGNGNRVLYDRLVRMGKTNIHSLEPWSTAEIDAQTRITIFPSDQGWVDSSCCIQHGSTTLYHGNDNYITPETQRLIADKFSIDIAFLPFAGFSGFPTSYLFDETTKKRLADKKKQQAAEQFFDCVENLNPRYAVPAAGDLILVGEDVAWMNYYDRCSPDDIRDWADKIGLADKILVMKAGDIFDTELGFIPHPERAQWSYSIDDQLRFASTPEVKEEVDEYLHWLHDVHPEDFEGSVLKYFRQGLEVFSDLAMKVGSEYLVSIRATGHLQCDLTIDFSNLSVELGFSKEYVKMIELPGSVLYRIMRRNFLWGDAYSSGRMKLDRRPPEYYNREFWRWLYSLDGLQTFEDDTRNFGKPPTGKSFTLGVPDRESPQPADGDDSPNGTGEVHPHYWVGG